MSDIFNLTSSVLKLGTPYGPTISYGLTDPNSSSIAGQNGDIYIRTGSSAQLWQYVSGIWSELNPTDGPSILETDGTAALPAYSFSADPNTGIYRSGNDSLSFSTGGVQRVEIDSSGNINSLVAINTPLFTITGSSPTQYFYNTSGVVDSKRWGFNASATTLEGTISNDVNSTTYSWLTVTRSANSISTISFKTSTGNIVMTVNNSSQVLTSDGTAALPVNSFISEDTSGIYRSAAGVLGISITGTAKLLLSSTVLYPAANDGLALGSATLSWADLFLATGSVINFANSDVTVTHAANTLTFAGADSGIIITGSSTTASSFAVNTSTITTGNAVGITVTSTAGTASGSSYAFNITRSGANTNSSHTAYGVYSSVTNTGTTNTNIAGYFNASGATTNYGLIVNAGWVGIGTNAPSKMLQIAGNITTAAWTTAGINFATTAATYTDNTTAASGTVALRAANVFAIPTNAHTNTSVTITDSANLYIAGAPAAGTNTTQTNAWALYVASGSSYFAGNIQTPSNLYVGVSGSAAPALMGIGSDGGYLELRYGAGWVGRVRAASTALQLQVYNGSAWINAQSINTTSYATTYLGVLLGVDGTVSTPAYSFSAETTSGLYRAGAGYLSVAGSGLDIARFKSNASAVNYFEFNNSTTTNPPTACAAGSDSNIGIKLHAKGNGPIFLDNDYMANAYTFYAAAVSTVNGMSFGATATGVDPWIQASGSDTDRGILLLAKGNGDVKLGNTAMNAAHTFSAPTGSVNGIQFSANITANAPTIKAIGSDTNIDLWLYGKGTGNISFVTNTFTILDQNAVTSTNIRNSNTGTSAASCIYFGNSTSVTDAFIFLNGTNKTDYAGARSLNILTNTSSQSVSLGTANTVRYVISGVGAHYWNTTTALSFASTTATGLNINSSGSFLVATSSQNCITMQRNTTTGNIVGIWYGTTVVGTISVTAANTAYNTSSDYRIKEDWQPLTKSATSTLMDIPVYSLIYKNDPEKKRVIGLLAHELQARMPEAVTGEKDAVDADGNPIIQMVDYSKLVTALLAMNQEQQVLIETMQTQLTLLQSDIQVLKAK